MPPRVLILDGNTTEGNAKIVSLGGKPYGEGYSDALRFFDASLDITILHAAGGETLPRGLSLSDFDGIAWTGSALSAYWEQLEVARQIELAKAVHASGVPCFGSCWGQQIMCQALGGEVRANPNGIEIGIARKIRQTTEGNGHPMFLGKPSPFDALAIHRDEVIRMPPGGNVLAENNMSAIQAMELAGEHGNFWAVQYHPEFDLAMIAMLYRRDEAALVRDGLFETGEDVQETARGLAELQEDPANSDLAEQLYVRPEVIDPAIRMAEFGNWLEHKVRPYAALRV